MKMRKTQVQIIVFRKNNNSLEFLLLKRIPSKGGFWQPPCGGLEKEDSSIIECAYREVFEETNIAKEEVLHVYEDVYYFVMDKHYLTKEPITPIEEFVFGFEVLNKTVVDINKNIYPEHEEFRWVSFHEALDLLKWEDNKIALKKLREVLKI